MSYKIIEEKDRTFTARVWACRPDVFGKRTSKQKGGFSTYKLAKHWAEEEEYLILDSDPIMPNENMTFLELENLYLNAKKDKQSPTTVSNYKYRLPMINDILGSVKIRNINTRVVEITLQRLYDAKLKANGKGVKKSTLERDYRFIQAVLNWGVGQGYLDANRCKRPEYPITSDNLDDGEIFEPTTIDAETLGRILAYLKRDCYNLYIPVLISASMSARRGEALAIKWEDVDFEKNTIKLKSNRINAFGQTFDKSKLKTSSSRRIIVMNEFVKRELLEHKKFCKGLESEYVCANPFDDFAPLNPDYITHKFPEVILAKFGIKMRVQDLRCTFNQFVYEDGSIDETTRLKLMGHTQADTNRNYYTKVSVTKNKGALDKILAPVESSFTDYSKV